MKKIVSSKTILSPNERTPSKQYSVLYVEDNAANLRLVTQIFTRIKNIHLLSAPEPLLGIELAKSHLPNLILLDINLPGLSGFETLERLRLDERTQNIPIIAVSANAMAEDIEKAKSVGFNEYITKPIDVSDFISTINNMLG